jgi:expansin (peptidoglycan-binding protein)
MLRPPALPLLLLLACNSHGSGDSDAGDASAGGGGCELDDAEHQGEGTYYGADGSGNCSFPPAGDLMVAAMNELDYAGSAVCGACVAVDGPQGSVTVRIVDRCPGCAPGDIDLSQQAFERIAPLEAGRVPIRWRTVACDTSGPLIYHFKDGSNPYWTAVQIRGHRHPIATFEWKAPDGQFRALPRETYNYFVEAGGMGEGPLTFRVTDVLGNVVEDAGIPLGDAAERPSAANFPACPSG